MAVDADGIHGSESSVGSIDGVEQLTRYCELFLTVIRRWRRYAGYSLHELSQARLAKTAVSNALSLIMRK